MFSKTLVNRLEMPSKHILVCDDVILQQARMLTHLADILPHEGNVEVTAVSGGKVASEVIKTTPVDLIILDHDMPNGSGPELLKWMAGRGIPVITFSGIPSNNDHLMNLGATYKFQKDDVINGAADEIMMEIVA